MRKKLYAACALVLVAGLACAGWIYRTAEDGPDLSGAYQIIVVDGVPQTIAPGESKAYVRDLRRYGGKTAVLFDEIDRWFMGLWQGRSLALTVAFLALVVSCGLFLVAAGLPEDIIGASSGSGPIPKDLP
ncbi:MAG TPA: hypothetical protein VFI80_02390 [Burkholderiales bacterium]|nr:hypothetical protein [Burkholderiales bacterium]